MEQKQSKSAKRSLTAFGIHFRQTILCTFRVISCLNLVCLFTTGPLLSAEHSARDRVGQGKALIFGSPSSRTASSLGVCRALTSLAAPQLISVWVTSMSPLPTASSIIWSVNSMYQGCRRNTRQLSSQSLCRSRKVISVPIFAFLTALAERTSLTTQLSSSGSLTSQQENDGHDPSRYSIDKSPAL